MWGFYGTESTAFDLSNDVHIMIDFVWGGGIIALIAPILKKLKAIQNYLHIFR